MVLEGELTLAIEDGEKHALGPRSAARVAPEMRRQLSNRGNTRLALLAMGGASPTRAATARPSLSWDDAEGKPPHEVPLPADL